MRCTIAHFNDAGAVLRLADGKEITVPLAELPDGAAEGDTLNLRCSTDMGAAHDEGAHARSVLNALLDSKDEA